MLQESPSEDLLKNTLELLKTDIELAFTFLNTARISNIAEIKKRNIENARNAYRFISEKLPQLDITADVGEMIRQKLSELQKALLLQSQAV